MRVGLFLNNLFNPMVWSMVYNLVLSHLHGCELDRTVSESELNRE